MSPKTAFSWLPVTTMADGSELRLPLHTLKGAKPGPTLGLTALIHGDEALPSIAILRRVFELIDPSELSGSVLAVPVCNPLGAGSNSRNTPLDGANMNAAFGIPPEDSTDIAVKSPSELMAAVLMKEVLPQFNFHIDFHAGDDGMAVNMIEFSPDPESTGMARAFGMPLLLKDAFGGSQIWGAAERAGAKVIVAECGGGGLLFDEWLDRGVNGTLNVMRHLGMLPGEAPKPPRQIVLDNTHGHHRNLVLLRARQGGLVIPEPGMNPRAHFAGQAFTGMKVMGKMISSYDLSVREVYETPFERTMALAAVVGPSWRAAGDTLYIVADADLAEVWE